MKITIETNELSTEEAENLMECMLTHYGWSGFVDKIKIGNQIFYDLEDDGWQKFLKFTWDNRIKRRKKWKAKLTKSKTGGTVRRRTERMIQNVD